MLLTRSDGTLLSVHAADIDWKATAAARNATRAPAKEGAAVQAPPERPAQATRAGRDRPKARLKLADADVAHVAEDLGATPASDPRRTIPAARISKFIVDAKQIKASAEEVNRGVRIFGADYWTIAKAREVRSAICASWPGFL